MKTTRKSDATERRVGNRSRRRFLALAGGAGVGALAGCSVPFGNAEESGAVEFAEFRGSGPIVEQRDLPEGTSIEDLPDLSGELTMYLGGGEGGLYLELIRLFERVYDDFSVSHSLDSSSSLANTIIAENEEGTTHADVFMAVDAGSLGAVAEAGATSTLQSAVLDPVPDAFHDEDGRWVGFAGRARAVPYNTNELSASDVPDTVQSFPETDALANAMGWAPSYGAFQSFVTAMRLVRGDDETRRWLSAMQDHGLSTYKNEFVVSNAVADGELTAGFANHYYALRVQSDREDAPVDLAFTKNDAGALVNVSGAEILSGTENEELATNFVRHLLSAEAQEFFATRTFAYPMIAGVDPVGGLPTVDELSPPDVSLTELADVSGTVDLLREVGVL